MQDLRLGFWNYFFSIYIASQPFLMKSILHAFRNVYTMRWRGNNHVSTTPQRRLVGPIYPPAFNSLSIINFKFFKKIHFSTS